MLLAFALWGALAHEASIPRFFLDELYYMEAGVSVGQGDGLAFRGESWGYGPLFPLLIGAIVKLTNDQETTYALVKVLNAAWMALAAVPVFVLARRVLPPWPSVGMAAAAVALPSTMYASVVMTESLAYLLTSTALAAMALALERPTVLRQGVALAAIVGAVATRPQLVSLYAGYLLALGLVVACQPALRVRLRRAPAVLWPTALSVAVGVAWMSRSLLSGEGIGGAFGSYSELARSYDVLGIARWIVHHVGDLALYLGIIPVAAAPAATALLWFRGRRGEDGSAAVVALAVGQTVSGLAVVGAFASTEFGQGLLYDRYLFSLVPLWLVAFAIWLRADTPRSRRTMAAGVLLAVLPVATLPFGTIGEENWFRQFQAVSTEVWGKVALVADRLPLVSVRGVAIVAAVLAVTATFALPARWRKALPAAVGVVLLANLLLAWRSAFVDSAVYGIGPPGTRSWVDDVLPPDARAKVFTVARACNRGPEAFAGTQTEFFNRTVVGRAQLGGEGGDAPEALRLRPDGRVVTNAGQPFDSRYVVAQAGIELDGTRLASGMRVGLVLWETGGPVVVTSASSEAELFESGCG